MHSVTNHGWLWLWVALDLHLSEIGEYVSTKVLRSTFLKLQQIETKTHAWLGVLCKQRAFKKVDDLCIFLFVEDLLKLKEQNNIKNLETIC